MADHNRSTTKHQNSPRPVQSGLVISSEDHSHNRSDRDDSYNTYSHGTAREERAPRQRYPQSDRGRHTQYDYASNRYSEPEDRLSGSVMKDQRWTSHDRTKTINSRSHEGFNDVVYGRESSNPLRNTIRNTPNERRQIRGQERYDRKDEPGIVRERRHHWDNEYLQDNYKHKEEEERERQEAKSPAACNSSSDVTSFKPRYKDRGIPGDLNEQMGQQQQHPYTADRRSERHKPRRQQHNISHTRPSSRGSSHSLSSASDGTDDSRETDALKEGSSSGRRLSSLRDRRRSPSPSGSPSRSESRHSGGTRSKSHSRVKKDGRSSHSHKHSSGKRKHRDRSASPDDRKRRKRKEREREKDKEISRERKKDEERRSVLTGKKIKLKVKKDKGDHERDANRKDLLQFLNSAFE